MLDVEHEIKFQVTFIDDDEMKWVCFFYAYNRRNDENDNDDDENGCVVYSESPSEHGDMESTDDSFFCSCCVRSDSFLATEDDVVQSSYFSRAHP